MRRKTRHSCLGTGQALPENDTVSKDAGMQVAQRPLSGGMCFPTSQNRDAGHPGSCGAGVAKCRSFDSSAAADSLRMTGVGLGSCFPTSQKRDVGHPCFVRGWKRRVEVCAIPPFRKRRERMGTQATGLVLCVSSLVSYRMMALRFLHADFDQTPIAPSIPFAREEAAL